MFYAQKQNLGICDLYKLPWEIWHCLVSIKVMKHYPSSDMTVYYNELWAGHSEILVMYVHILWPWQYDLRSRSWHTLRQWTTIVWNIIQIQHGSEELWSRHGFWMCVMWPWPWEILINIKQHSYSFRYQNTAVLPQVRTSTYGIKSFRYSAAKLWNSLPNEFCLFPLLIIFAMSLAAGTGRCVTVLLVALSVCYFVLSLVSFALP